MPGPSIVTVNVSLTTPPTPSNFQKLGAFITQGGTTLAANATKLLTQLSDLTSSLAVPVVNSTLVWSGGTVTGTTATPHGWPVGQTFSATISAAATPSAYSGTFQITPTGASTYTYPLVSNPGANTVPGTVVLGAVAELLAMATTFFAQGGSNVVTVLELGIGNLAPANGITAFTTYLTNNPLSFYAYLVPREWDSVAGYLTLLGNYASATAKQYFFTTTTTANYINYTPVKSSFVLDEAPGVAAANVEFTCSIAFWRWLNYTPSTTNKVAPFAFSLAVGVTPYPTVGNGALLTSLKAANVNVILTGAEGGLTNTYLYWGTMMDGNDATYWYAVDWMQINTQLVLANAIINGSNNAANPLYYNQDGINRLQGALQSNAIAGVSYGLLLGQPTQYTFDGPTFTQNYNAGTFAGQTAINAIPLIPYLTVNPSDYKIGKYSGFTEVFTPNRGFTQIVMNIIVTQFVAT